MTAPISASHQSDRNSSIVEAANILSTSPPMSQNNSTVNTITKLLPIWMRMGPTSDFVRRQSTLIITAPTIFPITSECSILNNIDDSTIPLFSPYFAHHRWRINPRKTISSTIGTSSANVKTAKPFTSIASSEYVPIKRGGDASSNHQETNVGAT